MNRYLTFTGFDQDALALLDEMPGWDAEAYSDHRVQLARGVTQPGLALITEVAKGLDANLTVEARRSVSPLHRDLRFAAAGTPRYKDHLLLTAWEGIQKQISPILWIRIDAHSAGFASGMAFTPAVRDDWRKAIGGAAGEELVGALEALSTRNDFHVTGDTVKKVPSPWLEDHPRADLLRLTGFQVRFRVDLPEVVARPDFAEWCVEQLAALLPIHRWLIHELS